MSSKKRKKDNKKHSKNRPAATPAKARAAAEENIIDEQDLKDMFSFEPDDSPDEAEPASENTPAPEQPATEQKSAPAPKPAAPEKPAPAPKPAASEKTAPAPKPAAPEKPAPAPKPAAPDKIAPAPKPAASEKPAPAPKPAAPDKTAPAPEHQQIDIEKSDGAKPVKKAIPRKETHSVEEPVPVEPKAEPLPAEAEEQHISHAPKEEPDEHLEALLDRDLARANRRKVRKDKREEMRREKYEQEVAEQLAKARKNQDRANRSIELAAKRERQKAEQQESEHKVSEVRPVRKERDPMLGMNILKAVTVLFVVAGLAYAGGLIYAKTVNDEYIESMEKELMGIAAAGSSSENDRFISDGKLSAEEKRENGLTLFLPDTDKDGLSDYYEINISNTDPKNADTDGDDTHDGAELLSGLNPLSASDSGKIVNNTVEYGGAKVEIEGKAQNAFATIDPVTNNSILGTTGIVGDVYEFYTVSSMQKCRITLTYEDEDLEKLNTEPANLSIFRFNSETLTFDKIESTVDPASHTVSADIDSIGIYTIGNSAYIQGEYTTNIFFLIDNSGSMYSELDCPGSEENDLEFKRVDFANGLIDRLGSRARFGAAKFTGTYTIISQVTDDRDHLKEQIDSIRTADHIFDGTDITGSLNNAIDELGTNISDRNYIVLLTDGYSTKIDKEADDAAIQRAVDNNITVFTVGLGKKIDVKYLTRLAEATNGQFFQVSNADALDTICEKIESFMSYNKTTVSISDSGGKATDVYILADTGFNVAKDSLAYNNFRTDFSENGTDYGIAELTREYYTGELKLVTDGYTTDSGDYINGYDLGSVGQLVDGKPDLVDLKIDYLDEYNKYLELKNKWNYRTSSDGVLRYTPDTALFLSEHGMNITIQPYTVQMPELERWFEMLQSITFQKLPEFTSYECAIITTSLLKGTDWDIINAFCYMQHLHDCSDKCDIYDFGYHGDQAYDILYTELKRGNPVVISLDGAALNAVRLLRESENTNKLVLEAYDCNNLGTTTYISLRRTTVYDDKMNPYHQYSATVGGKEVSLKMYITKN